MTLRKWIDHLDGNQSYKYFMHMGNGFYTEMPLEEILTKNGYASHQHFKIKIEDDKVYVTLIKPWSHKGRFRR